MSEQTPLTLSNQTHANMSEAEMKKQADEAKKKEEAEKKKVVWRTSEAKKLLLKDLRHRRVPLDAEKMPPKVVYQSREEFQKVDEARFFKNLARYRKEFREKKGFANDDSAALAHDRRIFPKPTVNHRGEPTWEDSPAQQWLFRDMDNGLHLTMKPKELYESRPVYYKNYYLSTFRGHIDQEKRSRRFQHYVKVKREKEGRSEWDLDSDYSDSDVDSDDDYVTDEEDLS